MGKNHCIFFEVPFSIHFENAAGSLLDAFMNLDKNSDSIIEVNELKPLLIQIGYGDLDDEGIQKIIDIFDENGDGEMDFLEFIEFFSYVAKNLVKKNPKAKYLKYLFDDSDSD